MAKADYSNVRIFIAIESQIVRKAVFDILRTAGYSDMTIAVSQEDQDAALAGPSYDLIILTYIAGGRETAPLIANIRNGKTNHHRFPIVVMLLEDSLPENVQAALSCGADAVLVIPVAPSLVLSRVTELTNKRKPFVVTRDYTGPDRRKEERKDSQPAPTFEAPNPLRARLEQITPDAFEQQVQQAAKQLNGIKVERYGTQISWVVAAIGKMLQAQQSDPNALASHCAALEQTAAALPEALGTAMTTRLYQLLAALVQAARTIGREGVVLTAIDFELLSNACTAMLGELAQSGFVAKQS